MTAVATEAVATWVIVHGTSDIYWRCELPAAQFGSRLIIVPMEHLKDFSEPNMEPGEYRIRWQETEDGAYYPDIDGTVGWTRPDQVRAIHAMAMRANGHRIICEVDDNFLSPPSQNIFMRYQGYDADSRLDHMLAFARMEAIVFSTD